MIITGDRLLTAHTAFLHDVKDTINELQRDLNDTAPYVDRLEKAELTCNGIGANSVYNLGVQTGVVYAIDTLLAKGYKILNKEGISISAEKEDQVSGAFAEAFYETNWQSVSS